MYTNHIKTFWILISPLHIILSSWQFEQICICEYIYTFNFMWKDILILRYKYSFYRRHYLKSIRYVGIPLWQANFFKTHFKRNHNGYKLYNLYGYIVLCDWKPIKDVKCNKFLDGDTMKCKSWKIKYFCLFTTKVDFKLSNV